ncbi:MAG: hypothetical protein ACR2PX_04120 [Endozoicomonas sp.]|uniref:hypothetical protein n=1 Tax=Endozoicomonas sp. TaxID=1892382 RepID=UPI003D9B244C
MSGDLSAGRSGAGSPAYVAPGGTNDKQSEGPVQAKSDIQGKLTGLNEQAYKGKSILDRKARPLDDKSQPPLRAKESNLQDKAESLRTDWAVNKCLEDVQALKANPEYKPADGKVRVQLESGQ